MFFDRRIGGVLGHPGHRLAAAHQGPGPAGKHFNNISAYRAFVDFHFFSHSFLQRVMLNVKKPNITIQESMRCCEGKINIGYHFPFSTSDNSAASLHHGSRNFWSYSCRGGRSIAAAAVHRSGRLRSFRCRLLEHVRLGWKVGGMDERRSFPVVSINFLFDNTDELSDCLSGDLSCMFLKS
jgi:hypothetical protein